MLSSLVIAAALGLPLAWDGSWYLYRIVADQAPFIPHDRLFDVVLQAPAVLVAFVPLVDLTAARISFALMYTLIPLFSFTSCLWILRRRPALCIWPAFGIGVALLPGSANFVSESQISIELGWPILCAATVGVGRRELALTVGLAVALVLAHPIGAILLFAAAVVSWVTARLRRPPVSTIMFAILGCISAVWFGLHLNPYELSAISGPALSQNFALGLAGAPLTAVVLGYLSAALAHGSRSALGKRAAMLQWTATVALVMSGGVLVVWSANPTTWRFASEYRAWAPIVSTPFFAFLWLERRPSRLPDLSVVAGRVSLVTVALFSVASVITLQTFGWQALTTRLQSLIDESRAECVDARNIQWVTLSPLYNWSLPPLSRVIQSRNADSVVLIEGNCATSDYGPVLPLGVPPFGVR